MNSKSNKQKSLKLHDWNKEVNSKKANKRVGRGIGSGTGKTSTRGHKGQRSRSGHKISSTFEGGQMSFQRRIPKVRGFNPVNKKKYQVVNLSRVAARKMLIVNKETLFAEKLIRKLNLPIKILGVGDLNFAVSFQVDAISKVAINKIKKAKGQIKSI